MNKRKPKHASVIFDVLYGFIPLTEWEEKIVHTPFFQRLRWIRQLGFANYIFPGAEHTRFAHALGVMHSMHQMITALGIGAPEHELYSSKAKGAQTMLHKSLRIAALLHDLGTFPFSHAIEYAYIRHGIDNRRTHGSKKSKDLPNNHEHLGSYIIKNTNYEGGITRILQDYGFDVQMISRMIKGDSPYLIANQLMHSDLDADRMDYLLRDSYYTGIKYGQFDRDYILANLEPFSVGRNQTAFGIRENAVHAVEDFLIARFGWYSQVIKNPASAKFDILSSHIAKGFLENDLIHQFNDLLNMIDRKDERFFWWNDNYLITRCQEVRYKNQLKDPRINEFNERLLFRNPPKTVHHPLFGHRILRPEGGASPELLRERLLKKVQGKVAEFENVFEKHGTGREWILPDIPVKDVIFTAGLEHFKKKPQMHSLLMERDPVKIVPKHGSPKLLVELDNTLMKTLSGIINFVPNVYGNDAAVALLEKRKLI